MTAVTGPLKDLLVVDLSRALAGPHATMMLADMGARVIKVEVPERGDDSRAWGPPFVGSDDAPVSTYFLSCNRNKESVTADLTTPDGKQLLRDLIARADVVVENFRAGVMDRLGFGLDDLRRAHPRLVILSITGFGHDGPQSARPGYDQIVQGEAGLMSFTGPDAGHPTRMGVPIADLLAGMYGAYGVLAALHDRDNTGEGRIVRTSLLAAAVGIHTFQGTKYTVAGAIPEPVGNFHAAIAPYGMFRCRDGALQVAAANPRQWLNFARTVGLDPEDPRFATNADRLANREQLRREVEERLRSGDALDWREAFDGVGVPCGQVRTLDQVYADPQVSSQGLVVEVDHPRLGTVRLPGPPVRFDRDMRTAHDAPPDLGEHNEAVRAWLAQEVSQSGC